MKVKALAGISGRPGRRAVGDEFTVDKEYGALLIGRGLVAEVKESVTGPAPVEIDKPAEPSIAKA